MKTIFKSDQICILFNRDLPWVNKDSVKIFIKIDLYLWPVRVLKRPNPKLGPKAANPLRTLCKLESEFNSV